MITDSNKYYIDFEFDTPMNNRVWLPLLIQAQNDIEAIKLFDSIKTEIRSRYSLRFWKEPIKVLSNRYNGRISQDIKKRMSGEIALLELDLWKFHSSTPNLDLSFQENWELIEFDDMLTEQNIVTTIERHKLPVKIYKEYEDLDNNEFLLLNVISPE